MIKSGRIWFVTLNSPREQVANRTFKITGFADTVAVIREATVKAIPIIAPKVSFQRPIILRPN